MINDSRSCSIGGKDENQTLETGIQQYNSKQSIVFEEFILQPLTDPAASLCGRTIQTQMKRITIRSVPKRDASHKKQVCCHRICCRLEHLFLRQRRPILSLYGNPTANLWSPFPLLKAFEASINPPREVRHQRDTVKGRPAADLVKLEKSLDTAESLAKDVHDASSFSTMDRERLPCHRGALGKIYFNFCFLTIICH